MLLNKKIKRSAIHNLNITDVEETGEGLIVPLDILTFADISPYQQVIATKIEGDNYKNRIVTFVLPGENKEAIVAKGSLSKFFEIGEKICLITYTIMDNTLFNLFCTNKIPLFDLGYNPDKNNNSVSNAVLDLEFYSKKDQDVKINFPYSHKIRKKLPRYFLYSLISNLTVTDVKSDCLQGSAEIPNYLINESGMSKYQEVYVYNQSSGGASVQTYLVSTPPGVVMMAGAMSKFAKKNDIVAAASYILKSTDKYIPNVLIIKKNELFTKDLKNL